MGNQYKLTLSNQTLYREVDLTDDMDSVTIGTAGGCDVRLRKELFFDTFELQLTRRGDKWEIICSESVYISVDQVRRLLISNRDMPVFPTATSRPNPAITVSYSTTV